MNKNKLRILNGSQQGKRVPYFGKIYFWTVWTIPEKFEPRQCTVNKLIDDLDIKFKIYEKKDIKNFQQ